MVGSILRASNSSLFVFGVRMFYEQRPAHAGQALFGFLLYTGEQRMAQDCAPR